jgi:hypothetical protein
LEVLDDNVTDETLRRLADLRAAVLESKAPDVVALRRLLRQLFKEITYADGKLFPNLRVHEAPCPVDERPLGWPREDDDPCAALDLTPYSRINAAYSENDGLPS